MLTLGWDKSFSRVDFPFTKYRKMISSHPDKFRCLVVVGKFSLGCLTSLKCLVCSLLLSKTPRGFHGRQEHAEIASWWESQFQCNEKVLCEKYERKNIPKRFKTQFLYFLRFCVSLRRFIVMVFWKLLHDQIQILKIKMTVSGSLRSVFKTLCRGSVCWGFGIVKTCFESVQSETFKHFQKFSHIFSANLA